MKKIILVALIMLIFAGWANAAVLEEFSLKDRGLSGLAIDEPDMEKCLSLTLVKENPIEKPTEYSIASWNVTYKPRVEESNAKVTTFLNGFLLKESNLNEIENDYLRVNLRRAQLFDGDNNVTVCGKTSHTTTQLEISSDSKIGTYLIPDFSQIGSFENYTNQTIVLMGETIRVTSRIKNFGSERTTAQYIWQKPTVDFSEVFDLISGPEQESFDLNAGEEKIILHEIKVKKTGQFDLPRSVLNYFNAFNELKKTESATQRITVVEPELKVEGIFLSESNRAEKQLSMQLAIHNTSNYELKNVHVDLEISDEVNVSGNLGDIALLKAGETRYFDLTLNSNQTSDYTLGCSIYSKDLGLEKNQKCQLKTIRFEKPQISSDIWWATIIVVIGVFVYLVAYRKLM